MELTLDQLKEVITALCPIKVIINGRVWWDDDYDSINVYDAIFTFKKYIVKEIKFKVVAHHHTIVKIKVKRKGD